MDEDAICRITYQVTRINGEGRIELKELHALWWNYSFIYVKREKYKLWTLKNIKREKHINRHTHTHTQIISNICMITFESQIGDNSYWAR